MLGQDESSDPDSTMTEDLAGENDKKKESSAEDAEAAKEEDGAADVKIEELSGELKGIWTDYFLIVLLDLVFPLTTILTALSMLSVMGMFIALIIYIYVLILNFWSVKSFKILQGYLATFMVLCIVIAVIASLEKGTLSGDIVHYLGLSFDNVVTHSSSFALGISSVNVCVIMIMLILMGKRSVKVIATIRERMFSTFTLQFLIDVAWMACTAFNASTGSSYCYFPILVYFVTCNVVRVWIGRNFVPIVIRRIIMFYSLLYALFSMYMISDIGQKWNPASAIDYMYIGSSTSKTINSIFVMLLSYISAQLQSGPKFSTKKKEVPAIVKLVAEKILFVAFVCTFIFGVFYPNYLSLSWLIIPFIASFTRQRALKKVLLPLLATVFAISFQAMSLTAFKLFGQPDNDGTDNLISFLRLFGLYRYSGDLGFNICGYYIIFFIGQIGEILQRDVRVKKVKGPELEVSSDALSPEVMERLRQIKEHSEKVLLMGKKAFGVARSVFAYVSLGGLITIGITLGFYIDRLVFLAVSIMCLLIVMTALYDRRVFTFVKFVTGVVIIITAYYHTTLNSECEGILEDDVNLKDKCMTIGTFGSLHDMVWSGLVAPIGTDLPKFTWMLLIVLALATYLTWDKKALRVKIPTSLTGVVFSLVSLAHIIYLFVYETDVFSLFFLLVGIGMFAAQYANHTNSLAFAIWSSSFTVSARLVVLLICHFNNVRNFIGSVVPNSVINVSSVVEPSMEVALLAVLLFFGTISMTKTMDRKPSFMFDNILYEARVILDLFYFYLCWIFIFMFSIVNANPSFIKFLLMLFFALGRWSAPVFWKIRIPFLIFNITYLVVQFVVHIGGWDDPEASYYGIMSYVGMYFSTPPGGKPTITERNLSVAWQLAVVFFGVINAKEYEQHTPVDEFENLASTRIYNAICTLFHHCLPLIVQISLCTSTLFNPSVFGWLSFIVMVIVNFKPTILTKGAPFITALFNVSFVAQYLLYNGWPAAVFGMEWSLYDHISPTKMWGVSTVRDWFAWLGIVDVKMEALTSNCISTFVFTFYLTWHNTFVDYDKRYDKLPVALRDFVDWFVAYIFEIVMSLLLIMIVAIKTIDGIFFFGLSACMFVACTFLDYSKAKALTAISVTTFGTIFLGIVSRMPLFTGEDIASWAVTAFDLPFQGSAKYEFMWIFIYTLERVAIHILHSDLYNDVTERYTKHKAFRFIRSRQLRVLEQLDQDIIMAKHENELDQIKVMAAGNPDDVVRFVRGQDKESVPAGQKEKKGIWQAIKRTIIHPLTTGFVTVAAQTVGLNSEAGMNIATLQSLQVVMRKILRCYESKREVLLMPKEDAFLRKLPPSFPLHFQSLLEIVGDRKEIVFGHDRAYYVIRYVLLLLRRISTPALVLMVLIYICVKPNLWAMFIFVVFIGLLLPLDIRGKPFIQITFFGLALSILGLRHLCTLDIIIGYIRESLNSMEVTSMVMNPYELLGIRADESSTCETLLFLCTILYVVDQMSLADVFPVDWYCKKFTSVLDGFPDDYCLGLIENPKRELGLDVEPGSLVSQMNYALHRKGITDTGHYTWTMILDVITNLVLILCWNDWRHGDEAPDIPTVNSWTIALDSFLVTVIIIEIVFSLLLLWCNMAGQYVVMYIVNAIWMLLTYLLVFLYLPTENPETTGSRLFYFILTFLRSLVLVHLCVVGRMNVVFRYPDFDRYWKSIRRTGRFIRGCPFVFEVQSLLLWMTRKSYTTFLDFMVIRDITVQLEVVISDRKDPANSGPPKPARRGCHGCLIFFVLAVLLFGPLLYIGQNEAEKVLNTPYAMELEVGIGDLNPLYTSTGVVSTVSAVDQKEIESLGINSLKFTVINDVSLMSVVSFSSFSYENWQPEGNMINLISEFLSESNSVIPFLRIRMYFDRPTSTADSTTVLFEMHGDAYSEEDKALMRDFLIDGSASALRSLPGMKFPLMIVVPAYQDLVSYPELYRDVSLRPSTSSGAYEWNLVFGGGCQYLPSLTFVDSDNSYKLVVWSEKVAATGGSGSSLIVYIIAAIAFGIVMRNIVLGRTDTLWIQRMERPQQLYRMIVAIDAFRQVQDLEKEHEMTQQFLNTLRSRETCLKIGS